MAIKFNDGSSSVKNIKSIRYGSHRIGAVELYNGSTIDTLYRLGFPTTATITNGKVEFVDGSSQNNGILYFGRELRGTIVPNSGYNIPSDIQYISVNSASIKDYDSSAGTFSLYGPSPGTNSVTMSATCVLQTFNISINSGDTAFVEGPSTIDYGATAEITITPKTGRIMPTNSMVQIVGTAGTKYFNRSTGKITIANPETDIGIVFTCPIGYKVTISISNGSANPGTSDVIEGEQFITTITPDSTRYGLPSVVTVNGVSGTHGTAGSTVWIYNPTTGILSLDSVHDTINIKAECSGVQLRAPTISLSGDTLSIVDNDGNSEEFEIYVDGVKMTTIPKSG